MSCWASRCELMMMEDMNEEINNPSFSLTLPFASHPMLNKDRQGGQWKYIQTCVYADTEKFITERQEGALS